MPQTQTQCCRVQVQSSVKTALQQSAPLTVAQEGEIKKDIELYPNSLFNSAYAQGFQTGKQTAAEQILGKEVSKGTASKEGEKAAKYARPVQIERHAVLPLLHSTSTCWCKRKKGKRFTDTELST